jgi:hypothetical protein
MDARKIICKKVAHFLPFGLIFVEDNIAFD